MLGLILYFEADILGFNKASLAFNDRTFFIFILPPIIFAGGYNLKKKKFFENFHYVTLFGIFGTLLNFVLMSAMVKGIDMYDLI